ncbi:MAG TPA: hypothetical protein VGK67_17145 [Myxococcales bacterium]|jgi:hypothetical protein
MRRLLVLLFALAAALAFAASCGTKPPPAPVAGKDAETEVPADAGAIADPDDAGDEGDVWQDPGLTRKDAGRPYPPFVTGDVRVGAVVENFSLYGFTKGVAVGSVYRPIELAEFYDPDGSKGSKTLFVNIGSRWCIFCKAEAAGDYTVDPPILSLNDTCKARAAKGLVCYTALLEDEAQNRAAKEDLTWWAQKFTTEYALVMDPNFRWTPYGEASAVPHNLFIDTRTMKLLAICHGADTECIQSNMDLYTQ